MKQYHDLVTHILTNGVRVSNRTGVPSISTFGYQMRFDLQKGFPAVTTKKIAWKSVVAELLWFLEGSTDERRLAELTYGKNRSELIDKTTIWTANADHQGKLLGYVNNDYEKGLGPIYGYNWRHTVSASDDIVIDQIQEVIKEIKTNPDSRRLIVSAWNVAELHKMALPPCHVLFQFRVLNNKLHSQLYQRSADVPLGTPFNIASYALLTHMMAKVTGHEVGELIYTIGDAHIYENQIPAMKILLTREPYPLPSIKLPEIHSLEDILKTSPSEYLLEDYKYHPHIQIPFAV